MRAAPRRVHPLGERALLVETDGTADTLALLSALRDEPSPHQLDLVPGARSLLVRFTEPVQPPWVVSLAQRSGVASDSQPQAGAGAGEGEGEVTVDVVYDGPDLDEVGALTGLGRDGVVTAHTGTPWRVAFCGFSPGFGYLVGGDRQLAVPRRQTPRTEVPPGSVGLAGEYSGVYPTASPGGWQLIGRTSAALWDLDRDPPALLRPGVAVRFRAVREAVTVTSDSESAAAGATTSEPRARRRPGPVLIVCRPGMQCTVQDLGRPGLADMGVGPSGAADRSAAMRANRIVGNQPGAAVLEILLGGAEFQASKPLLISLTGAPVRIDIDSPDAGPAPASMDRPIPLPAGARIRIGRPSRGLRSYLAVRGEIAVDPVLGSRATDLLSGIGPAALRAGDVLPIGDEHWGTPHPVPAPDLPETPELALLPGPQLDWFAPGTLDRVTAAPWTVSPSSNRVGLRLTGPGLDRTRTEEVPSQGLVRGAVQVPPSGELVVLLADHPVTGGYPVVAVLTEAGADLAAQARPGATVRFRSPAGGSRGPGGAL